MAHMLKCTNERKGFWIVKQILSNSHDARSVMARDHYNNNNNSYIALYHVNIYKLAALYIINIKIPLTLSAAIH